MPMSADIGAQAHGHRNAIHYSMVGAMIWLRRMVLELRQDVSRKPRWLTRRSYACCFDGTLEEEG
jgi:hypothetical protein